MVTLSILKEKNHRVSNRGARNQSLHLGFVIPFGIQCSSKRLLSEPLEHAFYLYSIIRSRVLIKILKGYSKILNLQQNTQLIFVNQTLHLGFVIPFGIQCSSKRLLLEPLEHALYLYSIIRSRVLIKILKGYSKISNLRQNTQLIFIKMHHLF